jgi:F-type H+-transporting ATPase subunit epsilon
MRLLITTPTGVVIDRDDVVAVRGEDATGNFGILDGHADFVTALTSSIVGWHAGDGKPGYCAVRRGVLTVTGGDSVAVATREAILGDDVEKLADTVLARFRSAAESEHTARSEAVRLQVMAIRQIVKYLRPDLPTTGGGS